MATQGAAVQDMFVEPMGLLDKNAEQIEAHARLPCVNAKCPGKRSHSGLTDNARDSCTIQVCNNSYGSVNPEERLTPLRDLLHEEVHLRIQCFHCKVELSKIYFHDTIQKLYQDVRALYTNDKTLPLLYSQERCYDVPDDASVVCRAALAFPAELLETRAAKIGASLRDGAIRRKLDEKMKARQNAGADPALTYVRIGIGMQQAFGDYTGVLEIWPVNHRSPKHQHGGCAGSVRVLHGALHCKIYDHLFSSRPIRWGPGEADLGLDTPTEELVLRPGDTTWLNRANWFCHEVMSDTDPSVVPYGFTASLHIYKSCMDEFEFVTRGTSASKSNPINDLFWNIDLPASDARMQAGVDSFNREVLGEGESLQVPRELLFHEDAKALISTLKRESDEYDRRIRELEEQARHRGLLEQPAPSSTGAAPDRARPQSAAPAAPMSVDEAALLRDVVVRLGDPAQREQAVANIVNLVQNNAAAKKKIVELGVLPPVVELLRAGSSGPVRGHAAHTLAVLAHQVGDNRVAIAQAGAIPPLVALLSFQGSPSAQQWAAETINNLAKLNSDNKAAAGQAGAIPPLVAMLVGSQAQQEKAAGALWQLAMHPGNKARLRESADAVSRLENLKARYYGKEERGRLADGALRVLEAGHGQ